MNEHNGSTPGIPAPPAADNKADDLESQLVALSEKLQRRGMKAQLVSYAADGVTSEHYDAITVTNPASPERGSMRIEKEGWVTWEYSGSLENDAGIGNLADEATNALRATGIPYQPEAVAMTNENDSAGLRGTHQQQLVFLNSHWGSRYSFAAPAAPGGRWTATAKFGQHDQIQGSSAAELLEDVRDHYQANKPESGRGDRF